MQLDSATAACTADGFIGVLKRVDAQMRLSLTYDQGREMAGHAHLSRQRGMQVNFAHLHSQGERGINENTNGLLREYLPKGSDLSGYSQAQLNAIAYKLNANLANPWAGSARLSCSCLPASLTFRLAGLTSLNCLLLHLGIECNMVFSRFQTTRRECGAFALQFDPVRGIFRLKPGHSTTIDRETPRVVYLRRFGSMPMATRCLSIRSFLRRSIFSISFRLV